MKPVRRLLDWLGFRCKHDWFPNHDSREFIVTTDVCLHCDATRVLLPYGYCLNDHPLREHYDEYGRLIQISWCKSPR